MSPQEPEQQFNEFPLDVIPVPMGWVIAMVNGEGERRDLMKPGWREERNAPFIFETREAGWRFLKQLFRFCFKQKRFQQGEPEKWGNCDACGRVFRAKFFNYCHECIQDFDDLFDQIIKGFYYQTGSYEEAVNRMTLLLKMSNQDLNRVSEEYAAHLKTINPAQAGAVLDSPPSSAGSGGNVVPHSRPGGGSSRPGRSPRSYGFKRRG